MPRTQDHDQIDTSAEIAEDSVLPMIHEVHTDPAAKCTGQDDLPPALKQSAATKSPAQWAYERMIIYIQKFEETLTPNEEVAMGFTGSNAGVIRIEGLGYFDPDILTFYGRTQDGGRTQLVQHVSQLNVMLRAMPAQAAVAEPNRIGFRLASDLKTRQSASG